MSSRRYSDYGFFDHYCFMSGYERRTHVGLRKLTAASYYSMARPSAVSPEGSFHSSVLSSLNVSNLDRTLFCESLMEALIRVLASESDEINILHFIQSMPR